MKTKTTATTATQPSNTAAGVNAPPARAKSKAAATTHRHTRVPLLKDTPAQAPFTLGLDLGDRKHSVCVIDTLGRVIQEQSIDNDREALALLAKEWPGALIAMEVGTHSAWVSRLLREAGMEVIVANARKVRAISQNERKCDEADAAMLARLARVDPALLHPLEHGSEQAQKDLLCIKMRDSLVRGRVALINAVRFTLKSLGHRVSKPSNERFHKIVMAEVPEDCHAVIAPMVAVLAEMSAQIKSLEKHIEELGSKHYPDAKRLREIDGVGPITSLCFVLKVGDPARFEQVRDIGPYLGLAPRRDQSGGCDKQLGISKCGDRYLRSLLVNAAQRLLAAHAPECALRAQGLKLLGAGSSREKKRAVVAVARKLAVLMLSIWKSGQSYERRAPEIKLHIERPEAQTAALN
jgi:transposase